MTDKSELKTCPFCGGEAEIGELLNTQDETYCVMCKECGCFTPFEEGELPAKLWNAREKLAFLDEDSGLLSCPLCGGKASVETVGKSFYITCDECMFTMRIHGRKSDFKSAWNKRHSAGE